MQAGKIYFARWWARCRSIRCSTLRITGSATFACRSSLDAFSSSGKLRATLMARVKKPLMVGAAVLGLMLLRPRRTLPLLLKASKLLRHATVALPVIRSVLQRMDLQRAYQNQK